MKLIISIILATIIISTTCYAAILTNNQITLKNAWQPSMHERYIPPPRILETPQNINTTQSQKAIP